MLVSRGIAVLKTAKLLSNNTSLCKTSVRNSHAPWVYRVRGDPPSKTIVYLAEGIQGVAWWWVLWHLWTQFDHITGEFEYPDASKWTDEELGIPPE